MYYRGLIKQVDTVGKIFREAEKRKTWLWHAYGSFSWQNKLSLILTVSLKYRRLFPRFPDGAESWEKGEGHEEHRVVESRLSIYDETSRTETPNRED